MLIVDSGIVVGDFVSFLKQVLNVGLSGPERYPTDETTRLFDNAGLNTSIKHQSVDVLRVLIQKFLEILDRKSVV